MRRLLRSSAALPSLRDVVDAVGLRGAREDIIEDERRAALAASAALWPPAALALLAAAIALVMLALRASGSAAGPMPGDLPAAIMARAAPAVTLALAGWAMLAHPRAAAQPSVRRVAAMILAATWIAISIGLMLDSAAALPPPAAETGQIALLGATMLTAIAFQPTRAAAIAFAATLAAMVMATHGPTPASLAAIVVAGAHGVATIRLALADQRAVALRCLALEEQQRARLLVASVEEQGPGWFWQADRTGRIRYLSDKVAAEMRALGIEPIGAALSSVFRVDSALIDTERTLTFHLSSRTSFADYCVRPAIEDAPERWWSISGRPVIDDLGRFQGFAGAGSDLTEQRRAEAEIKRLALFDSLTGLANRQRMRLSLEQTLTHRSGASMSTGLLLLDLDRFKAVNDTLGHQMGDELLKEVAQRLQRTIGDAGLVGRLGGDEFQVVIPGEGNRDRLGMLADRVIAALSLPYHIQSATLSIGCSVGVAVAPLHGDTPEALVRNADLALYAAKADGRGVHRFYREELLEGAQNRKRLEDDLRQALGGDQFHLTYQAVVSTADERIMGYEALLRWDHPERGAISPADFVPVAEECGLIETIGEWVMRSACMEAATWPDHVRVAVNVSPIQFANPALPAIVASALAASGLPAHRLELEITEGVFLNEDASSERMFRSLKGLGVRLALDDFGTGYSSLGYLKKAPFDKIKIDQSFVRGAIQPGNRNAAIIKAIVSLAQTLGMETTAEGVEQQDEIALIRDLGCSHIQGFVYGRPARSAQVREQLGAAGGFAVPIGHKTSRAPRQRMLRTVRLALGAESAEVRLRNLSETGAMIDGVDLPEEAIGHPVRAELTDGQWTPAIISWIGDGRAGLRFDHAIDVERLGHAPAPAPAPAPVPTTIPCAGTAGAATLPAAAGGRR
ncbi:MAG: EAL domain-containing protein [Sphingomonas adhaesiva]|uniref:EAL domain-containing protein n=1 Tax=Sphingomonas adhaesiva TaxID=28212 RepID=UPI002FFCB1B6